MGSSQQATLFEQYLSRVSGFANDRGTPSDVWRQIYNWYKSDAGRALFVQAFKHETGIKVNPETNADNRIGAAIPKSWSDYREKMKNDAYYRAHAEMFITEMDYITSRVPQKCDDPTAGFAYGNVQRFVKDVLLDSVQLFADWGDHRAAVPGAFGVVKNIKVHPVNFFHGARQTIYGHGSIGLSFSDNHAELAIATIRQAFEIRLRWAFGVMGKEAINDGAFHPVAISELLEVLAKHSVDVKMPVPLYNLRRINQWANLYMHSGMRPYAWTPPRVLDYLRPLLVGYEQAPGQWTVDNGIRMTRSFFDAIQEALRTRIESISQSENHPRFRALLLDVLECDVIIDDDSPTPTH